MKTVWGKVLVAIFFLQCSVIKPVVFGHDLAPVLAYEVTVMQNGIPGDNYNYRIPIIAIGPQNGTLFVVVEQRLGGTGDNDPKNIVYKYSEDNGITWSDYGVIFTSPSSGNIFLGNVVVDHETNTMFTIFTACGHPCVGNYWANYISQSVDDGRTWSTPSNISSQIGSFEYCGGPSLGVQKQYPPHVGRLIVCGHTEPLSVDGLFCLYSDNHGINWTLADPVYGIPYNQDKVVGDYLPDEAAIVELPNGDILVNARNQYHFHCPCRLSLISHDGAQTFTVTEVRVNEDLPDEACAAGFAIFDNKTLLFTNPDSYTERVNMTLKWSTNFGQNWKRSLLIFPGTSAYSSIATPYVTNFRNPLRSESHVYIVYERQVGDVWTIQLAVVDMHGNLNQL